MTESAGLYCCSEDRKEDVPNLLGPKNSGLVLTRIADIFGAIAGRAGHSIVWAVGLK
jgi:hypothetical protein